MAERSVAKRWRLLQGSQLWEGLTDPLDSDLRKSILIYGDHCQATYDTFISDRGSKYAGSSRYGGPHFFDDLGLTKRPTEWGYSLSKFIYATSTIKVPEAFITTSLSREGGSRESNWMGYVAHVTDTGKTQYGRRDITVAWRGTLQSLEWVNDFDPGQASLSTLLPDQTGLDRETDKVLRNDVRVQRGWFDIYTSEDSRSPFNKSSAREQVLREVKRLLEKYKDEEEISITTTGHSLGATLATLCAFDIVINGLNKPSGRAIPIPVTAIVFASPRVGNDAFKKVVDKLPDLRVLRVTNNPDLVPLHPFLGYVEVGVELRVDTVKSPYLKNPGDASRWHNLEAYLHTVAGTQGKNGAFKLEVDRDIALVNKSTDWLKDEYLVPVSWWVEKNKGMVQGNDGHWFMAKPPDEDLAD
uniref:Phospholipase A1 n=1 Tax=Picea sitchensis TaxID=3332 RepID=A9NRY8_PICSI|nr:unknown [Picea sitchensis]